jgi:hypothetical protein
MPAKRTHPSAPGSSAQKRPKHDLSQQDEYESFKKQMEERTVRLSWAHRVNTAKDESVDTAMDVSVWMDLLSEVLRHLTDAWAITSMKGSVIGPVRRGQAEQIVESLNTEEVKEWKAAVQKGVGDNNWEDLIFHRTHRLLSGALILLKHFIARLQIQSSSSDLTDWVQFQQSTYNCE